MHKDPTLLLPMRVTMEWNRNPALLITTLVVWEPALALVLVLVLVLEMGSVLDGWSPSQALMGRGLNGGTKGTGKGRDTLRFSVKALRIRTKRLLYFNEIIFGSFDTPLHFWKGLGGIFGYHPYTIYAS